MTLQTNARIAGFTFLLYIAAGIGNMVLAGKARGTDVASKLAAIAQHATEMKFAFLLSLLTCLCALVLAVTFYAITRNEDRDIALFGFACRVGEAVVGIMLPVGLAMLWLASATAPNSPDTATSHGLYLFLSKVGLWKTLISATLFSFGSLAFSWLLLRGRLIPAALAWLGVVASVVLIVGLPLQLAGYVAGPVANYMWIPMALFEIPLGFWLLFKAVPTR